MRDQLKGQRQDRYHLRQSAHIDQDRRVLPHAIDIPPDEIEGRYAELPRDRDVIAYFT